MKTVRWIRWILVGGVAWVSATGWAKTSTVQFQLQVDGLACSFCAYSVEKNLKAMRGVRSVKIDLDEGLVQIAAEKAVPLPEKVRAAVEDVGFTLRRLELTAEVALRPVETLPEPLRKAAEKTLEAARKQDLDLLNPAEVVLVGEGEKAVPFFLLAPKETEKQQALDRFVALARQQNPVTIRARVPVPEVRKGAVLPLLIVEEVNPEAGST